MRRISSKMTFWYKRLFPAFWFGFIALWTALACIAMFRKGEFQIMFIVVPIFMAGFGFILMKMLVWDLVDSAWDDGSSIIIKNNGKEDRIPFTNILNVSYSMFTNPPRITLTLREASSFGKEITFSPPTNWMFWKMHPIASELIYRIDQEKQKS